MNNRMCLAMLTGAAAMAAWAVAQGPGDNTGTTRVAVCDVAAVFEQAAMTKALEGKFKEITDQLDAEAKTMQEDIRAKRQELAAFDPISQDYQKREEALFALEANSESWLRSRQAHLRRSRVEWFKRIYQQTVTATRDIAQSSGIHVVLSDNPIQYEVPDAQALIGQIRQKNVIYASGHIDLTAQVVDALNRKFEAAGGPASIKIAWRP